MIYSMKITHKIQLQLWQLNVACNCWDIILIGQWLEWDRVVSTAFSDTPHYGATGSYSQWVMSLWRASGGILCLHSREREMEMQMGGDGKKWDRMKRWGWAMYVIEGTGYGGAGGWWGEGRRQLDWLDWISLTTAHVLHDILAVLQETVRRER